MAWVLRALDLIVAVANGSGGPGQRGVGAVAEGAGSVLPRWRSAGEGETGVPELETGCHLACEGDSGTCKLPMGLLGF